MTTTIIPAAPEIDAYAEAEAARVTRTGALMLAARYAGRKASRIEIDRRAIPQHNDDNADTIRPPKA